MEQNVIQEWILQISEPIQLPKYYCIECAISFCSASSLARHNKNKGHKIIRQLNVIHSVICPLCNETFRKRHQLQEHIAQTHNVNMSVEVFKFYCGEDFNEWKKKMEEDTGERYSKKTFDTTPEGDKVDLYFCHRSGVHKPRGTNSNRKSSKIGSHCPAYIRSVTTTIEEATQITVTFQSTHVGHLPSKVGIVKGASKKSKPKDDFPLQIASKKQQLQALLAEFTKDIQEAQTLEELEPFERFLAPLREEILTLKGGELSAVASLPDASSEIPAAVTSIMTNMPVQPIRYIVKATK